MLLLFFQCFIKVIILKFSELQSTDLNVFKLMVLLNKRETCIWFQLYHKKLNKYEFKLIKTSVWTCVNSFHRGNICPSVLLKPGQPWKWTSVPRKKRLQLRKKFIKLNISKNQLTSNFWTSWLTNSCHCWFLNIWGVSKYFVVTLSC